jgi:hypothetical protein
MADSSDIKIIILIACDSEGWPFLSKPNRRETIRRRCNDAQLEHNREAPGCAGHHAQLEHDQQNRKSSSGFIGLSQISGYLFHNACALRGEKPGGSLARPGKPQLREYECVYVLNDEEIGLFSDEVVVNCAP